MGWVGVAEQRRTAPGPSSRTGSWYAFEELGAGRARARRDGAGPVSCRSLGSPSALLWTAAEGLRGDQPRGRERRATTVVTGASGATPASIREHAYLERGDRRAVPGPPTRPARPSAHGDGNAEVVRPISRSGRGDWSYFDVFHPEMEWGWSDEFPGLGGVYRDRDHPNPRLRAGSASGTLARRARRDPRDRRPRGRAGALPRPWQGQRRRDQPGGAHVFELRDGKVMRLEIFATRQRALEYVQAAEAGGRDPASAQGLPRRGRRAATAAARSRAARPPRGTPGTARSPRTLDPRQTRASWRARALAPRPGDGGHVRRPVLDLNSSKPAARAAPRRGRAARTRTRPSRRCAAPSPRGGSSRSRRSGR